MIINGIAKWAKVVGAPQPGYDKTQKEWSIDLYINQETAKLLKAEGLGSKVKENDEGDKYISFKRKAIKSDGTASKPIRIVDSSKREWDGKTLIGNGSEVNISFLVNEVPYNGKVFKKPGILAIQVVKLVPYEGKSDDFQDYGEDADGNEAWD